MLEVDELLHFDVKSGCYAIEEIYAYVDASCLDLPKMRLIGPRHEGELSLRQALILSQHFDASSERLSVFVLFHSSKGMC